MRFVRAIHGSNVDLERSFVEGDVAPERRKRRNLVRERVLEGGPGSQIGACWSLGDQIKVSDESSHRILPDPRHSDFDSRRPLGAKEQERLGEVVASARDEEGCESKLRRTA